MEAIRQNRRLYFLEARIMPQLYEGVSLGIEKGEDVAKMVENTAREEGYEPKEIYEVLLCCAACHGNIKDAELCRNKGTDLDCRDSSERTPLWLPEYFRHNQVIEALGKWGARVKEFGHAAASSEDLEND